MHQYNIIIQIISCTINGVYIVCFPKQWIAHKFVMKGQIQLLAVFHKDTIKIWF